jgi:hypothetical protein
MSLPSSGIAVSFMNYFGELAVDITLIGVLRGGPLAGSSLRKV